ncbi:MAG TPA: hypothetical protein VNP96_04010, partial [Solirubrobacterales bacterium]|nr:hypothetical protein [Solirubrobacterales bacterium]
AAVIDEIVRAKPASAKGRYLISITLTTSMGPGIKVDTGVQREAEILDVEVDEASGNGAAPAAEEPAVEQPAADEEAPAEEAAPAEEEAPAEEPEAEPASADSD